MKALLTENLLPVQAKLEILEGDESDTTGKKKLYMKGIFIEGDVRNHNQRIYPRSEISKAVDNVNSQIKEGLSVWGECDHPEELTINIDRISHKIEKMWMEGNAGFGKLRILPTPLGNIIRTLIEDGDGRLGVSSRGSGNVDDRGHVSDFEIITVDIVCRPSAPRAYPTAVYEAFNHRRGAIIEDLAKAVAHDPKAQKHFKSELLNWISNLK